ncbi:Tektin-1 [Trichoplax sp. H2]|nr:Tektin-1 [Trichoplax sp. H2]|eukprot:RDD37820.1 Tektin-1 [Trichoplax sp. H2]
MAKLMKTVPAYTVQEWNEDSQRKYIEAEREVLNARRLREEAQYLCADTEVTTHQAQQKVDHELNDRVSNIQQVSNQLSSQLQATNEEIETLLRFKDRLERCLGSATEPTIVTAKRCLEEREKRIGIDKTVDNVDKSLREELTLALNIQPVLQKTLDDTIEQIRLLRSCKKALEKDLQNKNSAHMIDSQCSTLKNSSAGLGYHTDVAKIDTKSVTPETWLKFSHKNVIKAENERQNSIALRSHIEKVIDETDKSLKAADEKVDSALVERVGESEAARIYLDEQLAQVTGEIMQMEENVSVLVEAIRRKYPNMQIAQTRLSYRSKRPDIELCRDPVQYRLLDEVGQINASVEILQQKLQESEASLKNLRRHQLALDDEISVKATTLSIDRDFCLRLRSELSQKLANRYL